MFSFFVEVGLGSLLTKGKNPNRFRKIKFLFSARGVRLVFWDEQAAADRAISSTFAAANPSRGGRGARTQTGRQCAETNPILITGSLQFAGEVLAHLNGEPAAFEECAQ